MIEKTSELLKEHYFEIKHRSGLSIYVFPKKFTTTYALLSTKYGSIDECFRLEGEKDWITVPDGVAHFLEHKMFENPDGSDSFAKFSTYGADSNAYTSYNRTAYLFSCTGGFEESLEELLRFVYTPYFTPATVKKEQGIIGEEIRMYEDNPWDRCYQNLLEGMYEKNPVRKNICGTAKTIAKITDKLLYDCHRVFYRPSNMALVVCGDVTPKTVEAVVDRILTQEFDQRNIERKEVEELREVLSQKREGRMQVAKPIFSIGIKDPAIPKDPKEQIRRDAAMSILADVLFSVSSPFYSELFEKGMLSPNYSFGYSITDRFAFHSICGESDQPEEIYDYLQQYLQNVMQNGLDREAFERSRHVLYADEIRGFDSTDEIANNLLSFVFDEAEIFEYPHLLQSITQEEVEKMLPEIFKKEYFCLSVIRPLEK